MSAADSRIDGLVAELTGAFETLETLLEAEHVALVERREPELRETAARKEALAGQINALERELARSLSGRTLGQYFEGQRASDAHTVLRRAAGACRDQNEINGRLVRRARQSLKILLGNLLEAAPELYGADGEARGGRGGMPLASA